MADRSPTPPKFSQRIIQWLCREELTEEILGNLQEFYHYQEKSRFSGLFYWFQVFTYLRPSTLKRLPSISIISYMFHFNLRIAIRNLWKNRTHSLLNLAGFTLGLVCFILLYFHIRSELSYDSFYTHKDEIYRLIRTSAINGEPYRIGVTSAPYADAMVVDFPGQITSSLRVAKREPLLRYKDQAFEEEKFAYVDSNFFEFFDIPLIAGDPDRALDEPNSIILSQEMAQKYFGKEDPMGKIIEIDNERSVQVTGILGKTPTKTHLDLEFLSPLAQFGQARFMREWWWNSMFTYVKIP
ncbi:MAG: ABC transporter permease, partial [Bacteroidetes bacterium]|nr:ABC transporter permease [Bacteroidota bacterium]